MKNEYMGKMDDHGEDVGDACDENNHGDDVDDDDDAADNGNGDGGQWRV